MSSPFSPVSWPDLSLYSRAEPTSALAPELACEVLRVMRAVAEDGQTLITHAHEMGFAREVSNQAVFLHKGCIEEQSDPKVILVRPTTERLQEFLSNRRK